MPKGKLDVQKTFQGEITFLRLIGTLDESFEGAVLAAGLADKYLVISLADVRRITSFGIRQWVDFVTKATDKAKETYFVECAPRVIDQFNMVNNFGGEGHILSFYAPFRCDQCGAERLQLIQVDRDIELIRSLHAEGESSVWPIQMRTCPNDGSIEEFSDDPQSYLSYIAEQESFDVAQPVASFLASRAGYDVPGKIRIEKRVHGRSVGIVVTGVIGDDFPAEKIAEGIEGDVYFDLAGVGRVTEAGHGRWRDLMRVVSAHAERVLLLGMPMSMLEDFSASEDLPRKGQVVSLFLPYGCRECSITTQMEIDVADHYQLLSQGRAPELDCPNCSRAKGTVASEEARQHMRELPSPAHDVDPERARLWVRNPAKPEEHAEARELRERKKVEKLVDREVSRFSLRKSWALVAMVGVLALLVGGVLQHRCDLASRPPQPQPGVQPRPGVQPQPVAPAAGQPVAPAAGQPVAPAAGQPVAPAAGQPVAPAAGQPVAPAAGQPVAPAAGQPVAPAAGQPVAPVARPPAVAPAARPAPARPAPARPAPARPAPRPRPAPRRLAPAPKAAPTKVAPAKVAPATKTP